MPTPVQPAINAMINAITIAKLMEYTQKMDAIAIPRLILKDKQLEYPLLMGVINLSPDSAYRKSICHDAPTAIARGLTLSQQGACLIDIGVESTLEHAKRIDPQEQIKLLLPVIKGLVTEGILVSAESYHPKVLEAAAQAGAAIFNLTGTAEENDVYQLAAKYQTAVIHSYIQGEHVHKVQDFQFQPQMTLKMQAWFQKRLEIAQKQGVQHHILDPGLGFYYPNLKDSTQRVHHQLNTFLTSWQLHSLGWPIMNILPHAPEAFTDSLQSYAEPFFAVFALLGGTHIIRTHEVKTVAAVQQTMEMY